MCFVVGGKIGGQLEEQDGRGPNTGQANISYVSYLQLVSKKKGSKTGKEK